jgi:hypothetical protein
MSALPELFGAERVVFSGPEDRPFRSPESDLGAVVGATDEVRAKAGYDS